MNDFYRANMVCQLQKDAYFLQLNLPHRRLVVDDWIRRIMCPPQKHLYVSCGCFLTRCVASSKHCCDCFYSYNINDL